MRIKKVIVYAVNSNYNNYIGLKCARFSAFDSNLWLTGGYDCVIRITDVREAHKHICLAQYVGHKSIITDLHFTHDDSHIVSSSFDRTIKIWNARTAFPDKTLLGHTDAVTSCDLSADGRYIVSGSLDNTVRFWDFASGECITVIKKHTRWIKIVRFSPDSRYLATAGMDRKIYLWETKILANSRSPSHSRLLEDFNDYVLDMVLFRPTHLLASSRDGTIRLFDYISGHELQSVNLSPSWACTISISQNGEYFATGSFDNNVNIFRTRDFQKVREIRVFNLGILCVRFPKDLSYILVGSSEGFMQQIEL
jgi:WD40 repeat protein